MQKFDELVGTKKVINRLTQKGKYKLNDSFSIKYGEIRD